MKDEGVFCREAEAGLERLFDHAFERELIIPFGATGYIVFFEIVASGRIHIGATRPQGESDYH